MEIKTIFVLAGSFAEFKQFRREHPELQGADLRFGDRPEKFMGCRGAEFITYGSFYGREDAHRIEEAAETYLTDSLKDPQG